MQGGGSLQYAHFALVRAFADGTASIDRVVGELPTNDVARVDGHTFSNKPPGLAFATVPAYLALDAAGLTNVPRMLWALGLAGVVLPASVLVLLVAIVAERLAGGGGAVAGATLGVGTLLFPYSTVFAHHALAALLTFAAFALLWRERQQAPSTWLVALAGVVAGASVVAEYAGALVAAVLAFYAAARTPRLRRAAAWCGGVVIGALPLAAYNQAAFGSALRTSYSVDPSGRDSRLFGAPSLDVVLELLASAHGLLVLSPVLVTGAFGLVRIYRRGARAEALVLAAVPLAYLVFISAFYSPFGGFSAGPRYLVPASAFLAVGIAAAWRAAPLVTGALAVASTAMMVLLTATGPIAGYDWRWLDRLIDRDLPITAASLVGVTGWYAMLPLAVFAAVALASAIAVSPASVGALEPLAAGAALSAWALLALAAPETGRPGDYDSYLPFAILVALAGVAVALRPRLSLASARAVAR